MMQFQSNILNTRVIRPKVIETTALGAAYLAGLAVGYWKDMDEIKAQWEADKTFIPDMTEVSRNQLYKGWLRAVKATQAWAAV
jgi:glycerol kinase